MDSNLWIVNPAVPSWIWWALLAFMLLPLIVNMVSPGSIRNWFRSLFVQSTRTYTNDVKRINRWLMSVFRLGTLAMTVYLITGMLLLHNAPHTMGINGWLLTLAVVILVRLVTHLLRYLLVYTFLPRLNMEEIYQFYRNINTTVAILLYLTNVIVLYCSTTVVYVALAVVMLYFILVFLMKPARELITHPLSIVYILLYLMSLEILPVCGMVIGSNYVINNFA